MYVLPQRTDVPGKTKSSSSKKAIPKFHSINDSLDRSLVNSCAVLRPIKKTEILKNKSNFFIIKLVYKTNIQKNSSVALELNVLSNRLKTKRGLFLLAFSVLGTLLQQKTPQLRRVF
jgi:hypothetical protein